MTCLEEEASPLPSQHRESQHANTSIVLCPNTPDSSVSSQLRRHAIQPRSPFHTVNNSAVGDGRTPERCTEGGLGPHARREGDAERGIRFK
eukprot:2689590-Rhodomonas_salina.3